MRILLFALFILCTSALIREDLVNGTISLAHFENTSSCLEPTHSNSYVAVKVNSGDTIEGLLGIYASTDFSFPEQMQQFYQLNPVYQKQELVSGEIVKIPIRSVNRDECAK